MVKYFCGVIVITLFLLSCGRGNNIGSSKYLDNAIDQASLLYDSGYPLRSLQYVSNAYEKIDHGNTLDQYNYYNYFYNTYSKALKDKRKALLYADSMLSVLTRDNATAKLPEQYAQANFLKGDALFSTGDFKEADKYYYKAKLIAQNNTDSCTLDDYTYRLGMVMYKQERYAEAALNFKESLGESQYCNNTFTLFYRQQELLDNIGLCFENQNMPDSALAYYKKSISLVEKNFGKFLHKNSNVYEQAKAVTYGNMASVYHKLGNDGKAIPLLDTSIRINSMKGNDIVDAQYSRLKLAAIYLHQGNIPEMAQQMTVVRTNMDTLHNSLVKERWLNLIWQYYNHEHDPANALKYLLAYHALKDSLDSQGMAMRETDINERLKILDEQYQITALKRRSARKQVYLIIASIVSLMAAMIVYLVYQNWKKSARNVKTLTSLNAQINEQKGKLEKLLDELELRNKEKDKILHAVAHDIRNPLAAIYSLSDLLKDQGGYSDEQTELINFIKEACNDALSLSRDLLEAATPVFAGELTKEWTDIRALMVNSIDMLQFMADNKKQSIRFNADEMPGLIYINKEKIRRAIDNLISNAIKFSSEGGVIEVALRKVDNNISISVSDAGIGIPAQLKGRIFDMFTEAKRNGTSGEKPYGLGLSITKQIVEAHDGKIWFESEEGQGTTFYVLLPVLIKKEKYSSVGE